ncbi:unnamed protein product [Mytilus edulis]|uniref:Uncharacterized protein n=1 Tax=Mytilus edulis TaxID=6550 RepID=A0A8S3QJ12_MYTED|nr:unnamed protein product [Mytilus edulis]
MAIKMIPFSVCFLYLSLNFRLAVAVCNIPSIYHGDWYSQEAGVDVKTNVAFDKWRRDSVPQEQLECISIYTHPQQSSIIGGMNSSMVNTTMLMGIFGETDVNKCYYCIDVLYRTPNIIQYKRQDCIRLNSGKPITIDKSCRGITEGLPTMDNAITMFRRSVVKLNCITTIEGVYQFSYEVGGPTSLGGICNEPRSRIAACQDPGSAYVDNRMFLINYAKCRDVSTSVDQQIRYQCMGAWYAVKNGVGYTFAAVADTVEADERERFKCMMTLKDQKDPNNQIRWVMSRFPSCTSLNSIYDGDRKLVLTRVIPTTDYLPPQCVLPRNMSGTWFTQGQQFKSDVFINETHIAYKTKINEFELLETYYSCQQTQGTRYMMTRVTAGRCEVDFVCFDLMPRHHSVIRYRVGKPSRLSDEDTGNFMVKKFRETCSWMSFTYNRDETDWKYEVLILNPPTPVPCPIAGRFNFEQWPVRDSEKIATRIRGVTPRPRIQVDCRIIVSEIKSCPVDMNRISIDAEYCETVDYRGRPIGEYDVSDYDLTCVGFWMEDYKSYLITWDEEDAISNFRCWVYERLSWTDVMMSRSQNARCVPDQRADSFQIPGTGLALKLTESERLFDDCPQRFDPGLDPYRKPTIIYILNKSAAVTPSIIIISILSLLLTFIH